MARYVEPKFPEWLIHGIEKASITAVSIASVARTLKKIQHSRKMGKMLDSVFVGMV